MALLFATAVAVATPASAQAQTRTLTLTKNIAKGGSVTDNWGQIDCDTSCLTDTGSYSYWCEYDENYKPLGCYPGESHLTAAPAPGWQVEGWDGCDFVPPGYPNDCFATADADKTIAVAFVDVQNPVLQSTDEPVGPGPFRGPMTMSATATDNDAVARVEFWVDDAPPLVDSLAPYSVTVDTAAYPDGPRVLRYRAYDASGLASVVEQENVVFDNTGPATTIHSGPADDSTIGPPGDATWTFTASDTTTGVAGYSCAVDSDDYTPCNGGDTHDVRGLANGPHTFKVRATDGAGNSGPAVTRTFTVDSAPPETTITGGPADGSSSPSGTAAFAFASSEIGSTFTCRIYAAGTTPPAFTGCTTESTHIATGLGPGTYVFEVMATDALGNTDASPAKRTFTVTLAATETGSGTAPGSAPRVLAPGLSRAFRVTRSYTLIRRLVLTGVPAGATVALSCRGKGCPFRNRRPAVSGRMNLVRAFRNRRVRPASRIEIRVTAPGAVGRVFTITVRKGKPPTVKIT